MKRSVISISILLLLASFSPIPTFVRANEGGQAMSLHDAARAGDISQVRLLISRGADVNEKDKTNFTPLFYAAEGGKKQISEILIGAGADVNATDQYGHTPLHYAALRGHYDTCELLVAKGADTGAKNQTGGTALMMAKKGNHDRVVELLSRQRAKEETVTQTGDRITAQNKAANTDYVAELNKLGMAGRPQSDNAAPYYKKAIELYVERPKALEKTNWMRPKELSAQEQTLLKQWIQDNSRAFEQLQLGGKKSFCWFKQTGETLQIEMPHLANIRQLAFALQARAMVQAEEGNIAGANDIVTLYQIGAHLAAGPKILIEKLVGIAVKALSIKTAFNILGEKQVPAELMASLGDRFKQLMTAPGDPLDIRGEKISMQAQFETDPAYRGLRPYLKSTLEYYDMIAAKTPWQLHNEQTQPITKDNPLIENLGSSIANVIEIEYRSRAEVQALITTLAVLRYNAESDGYPAALPELVPAGYLKELPKDPFSDKLLVYKRKGDSFTLYSFGADFDDDSGLRSKWGYGKDGGDQVFWPVARTQVTAKQPLRESPVARTEQEPKQRTFTPAEREQASRTLHQTIVRGDINQVKSLLSKGADIHARNRMNWTPLHNAVRNRRQAIAELLISKGADVNAKDGSRQTPLHCAVDTGQKDVVELLIAKGADVNAISGRNDNALSLAKRKQQTEIVELLLKHGAEEPNPQDLMGDRYYGDSTGVNPSRNYEQARTTQRPTGTVGPITQWPTELDILADPNEIKARIKTFEGLEKAVAEVADKSQSELRQWQQIRYDNRTILARTVQNQFEEEIGFVRKVAVEEKAKKTTEAIDSLLSIKQGRFKKVNRELLAQKREQKLAQTQSTRTRGRGRTSGRSTRGQYPQRGQPTGTNVTAPLYDRGSVTPGMNRPGGTTRPAEQLDPNTENEIRQWTQATIDNKVDLARAIHPQIQAEISSVRNVAVEEEAKKTTAAIDGLLLARQERFDKLVKKMEEEKQARQQIQDQRQIPQQQGGRYRRRTPRGGAGVQRGTPQQGNQSGTQIRQR